MEVFLQNLMKEQQEKMEEMFKRQRDENKKEKDEMVKEIRIGIKEEIQAEMKPLEERTSKIEDAAEKMGDKVDMLVKKVTSLEGQLTVLKEKPQEASYSEVTRMRQPPLLPGREQEKYEARQAPRGPHEEKVEEKKELFRKAATVVGLKPIDKLHVQHIMRRQKEDMKNETEDVQWKAAMKTAVKMYLNSEMRIKGEDYDKLNIVDIFPPTKEDWNVLYVKLESQEQAQFLYTFTQYMRKNFKDDGKPEVQLYVPKQLYSRFMAINHMAFKIREESNKMIRTRVTLGKDDFVLQQRHKNDTGRGWGEPIPLPEDIPGMEFSVQRGHLSPGEAPGRTPLTPEHEDNRKRKKRSYGSPSTPENPPTKRHDMNLQEEIAAADLVSENTTVGTPPLGLGLLRRPEVGSVTSVQGQSTPKTRQVHPFFESSKQEANRSAQI